MTTLATRIPPNDLAVEAAVLGGCLIEPRILDRLAARLEPEDFYTEAHRAIYRRLLGLREAQVVADVITLTHALEATRELEFIGGPAKLADLEVQGATFTNVDEYVRIILVHSGARREIQILSQAILAAYDGTSTPAAIATTVSDELAKIAERTDGEALRDQGRLEEAPKPIGRILVSLLDQFDQAETDFVTCPFDVVNQRLGGGLLRTESLTLGGRPSVAKSAFVLQWARHCAGRGQKTLIISAEMKAMALGRRMLAQEARVSATALRRRDIDAHEWRRITGVMDGLVDLPLWIDDTTTTLSGIRRLVRGQDYRLVIVDYLQLVRAPEHRDRRLEVSAISSGLKRMAMRANCSVIALSSLTRLYTDKGKKVERPSMDKLKESGDIEADSDVVLLLHWPDTEQSERELIFAKVREGESGGAPLSLDFEPTFVKFVVPEPELPSSPAWVRD